jgi:hypothetical protein
MTFCGKCGTANPPDNFFCYNCGAKLTVPINRDDGEIARIGAYKPPEEKEYIPPAPEQQAYQQPYQQPPFQQYPPYPPYPPPQYNPYQRQPLYKQLMSSKPKYLDGAPDNNIQFRWISMGLSVAAFAVTLIALFGIGFGAGGHSYNLFGVGFEDGAVMALILSVLALIFGIGSIIVPIMNIPTGLFIMGAAAVACSNSEYCSDGSSLIVFIALGIVVIILGFIATRFMKEYVYSNVRNINLLQCCLMNWLGIRLPGSEPEASE